MRNLTPKKVPLASIAKKSLGQHFLTNPDICYRIANLLMPCQTDKILEIGPGAGALTEALRMVPHECLLLVEKDKHWADERMKDGYAQVRHMDIMDFDWNCLANGPRWKLIGNLPYNVASFLIWNIMEKCGNWERAVFMVQKEVAERICSAEGSGTYGALSIWVQAYAHPKLEFTLKAGAFSPPPKVDSAVISLSCRGRPPEYPQILKKLLHLSFQKRRKQIGGIFRADPSGLLTKALEMQGISPQARPEQLACQQFLDISDCIGRSLANADGFCADPSLF